MCYNHIKSKAYIAYKTSSELNYAHLQLKLYLQSGIHSDQVPALTLAFWASQQLSVINVPYQTNELYIKDKIEQ